MKKKKKKKLKASVRVCSVDYNAIHTSNILDIHRYLMKETCYKTMFLFIKNICSVIKRSHNESFDKSLAFNFKGPINCVSLNNQSCQVRPATINIKSDKTLSLSFYYKR